MLSLKLIRSPSRKVVSSSRFFLRYQSSKKKDCGEMKAKGCAKKDGCPEVPNQKLVCFPVNRMDYRGTCLAAKFTDYKRKVDSKTAWAYEPAYNPNDHKFDYNSQDCQVIDPCCVNERYDATLYKESDKRRKYQKTWLDCVDVGPVQKPCPPQYKYPEIVKRKIVERPKTATVVCEEKDKKEDTSKCARIPNTGCRIGRHPPLCRITRNPSDCKKRCCPFPSFSECCLEKELPPPDYCECGPDGLRCTGR